MPAPRRGPDFDDDELIARVVELMRRGPVSREDAKQNVVAWALVLAWHDGTVPGAVFDRYARTAPTAQAQRQLVAKLDRALRDRELVRSH